MSNAPKRRGRPPAPQWEAWDAKLGTMPDRVIAEAMGISQDAVFKRRVKLGVAAFRRWGDRLIQHWSQWDKHLGKRPDGQIAREMGLTPQAVSLRRIKLGIPPMGKTRPDKIYA